MRGKQLKRILLVWISLAVGCYSASAQLIDTVLVPTKKDRVYRVKPKPGSNYFWSIDCGSLVYANGADSMEVDWCNSPGVHTIKVIETTATGCQDTVVANVKIITNLEVLITGPKDICEGETALLSASGANSYIWSSGSTNSQITVTPLMTTTYSVIGFEDGMSDTAFTTVTVHPQPKALFTYSPDNPEANQVITFNFTGSGDKVKWFFDSSGIADTSKNPQHIFDSPGNKSVTLEVTNAAGCTDKITFNVFIMEKTFIFVPTAFTPNGDGLNDQFKVVSQDIINIDMQIYDRWGERIFESKDQNYGWDGTYKGVRVQDGAYLYLIEAQTTDMKWHALNGTLTVLR